jgi:type IV secretory pathway TraG/TraD family ATPase VirD4
VPTDKASVAEPLAWPGLVVGAARFWAGAPVCTGPEQALLVIGPPRSGKTTAVVVPNVLAAPGAVVATSTKTDLCAWSAAPRARRGQVWLFDPSGTTGTSWATRLCWSPLYGCESWKVASDRAHSLCAAAQPGAGLARADHWKERAEALIGPLLHAAALGHKSMAQVMRWVLRRDVDEAVEISRQAGGHDLAAYTIEGIVATDERERSGIFSTAAGVLSAYRNPAALEQANSHNFDPEAFVRSSGTVYICAPATEQSQLAPIVVAFLEALRRAAYARGRGWPPVLFALDEVANIAPLPGLPSLVSEGGSQGVVTLACLQDLSQARVRWGEAAEGFLTLFAWKMLLPGVADLRTLQLFSALAGERWVQRQSTTVTTGGGFFGPPQLSRARSVYAQRVPALPVNEASALPPGTALVAGPGQGPALVQLVPAWEEPWRAVIEAARVR